MLKGILKIRASYRARVMFLKEKYKEKFVERFLRGSIFDNKNNNDEIEILCTDKGKNSKTVYYCKNCNLIIFENNK